MKFTALILLITSIFFFFGCGTQSKPLYVNVDAAEQELQQKKLLEQEQLLREHQRQLEDLKRQLNQQVSSSANNQNYQYPGAGFQLQNQRVRVNQEIVNWIQQLNNSGEDISRLIFYLDRSFSMEIEETDISPLIDIANDGMLVINAQMPQSPINFSDIQQGKIITFTPERNETFVITTEAAGKHISMRFRKNSHYYEVFSMLIDSDNYTLKPLKSGEDLPILYIYASIDERIRDEREYTADYLAVPGNSSSSAIERNKINIPAEDSGMPENGEDYAAKETASVRIAASNEEAHAVAEKAGEAAHVSISANSAAENSVSGSHELIIPNTSGAAHAVSKVAVQPNTRTVNLIGKGTLTRDNVINFVKAKTRNPVIPETEITRLINLYIEEADYEEVNHDIAIAQMLYMTRVLGNSTYVESNNFAGLIPVQGEWDGSFPNMQRGVRAHIQHLRGYARENLNRAQNVNPRWNQISDFRGTINTLDELYQKWSSNPVNYKENIDKMLSDLYSFSEK